MTTRTAFYEAVVAGFNMAAVSPTGVTAGQAILVGLQWYGATTVTSVTVSSNSNATLVGSAAGPASGVNNARMAWYLLDNVTTGGSLTVQVTYSGNCDNHMNAWVLSGTGALSYDTSNSAGETTSANASVSLTAGANSDGLFGMCMSNGAEPTAGSGFTAETTGNQFYYESVEYKLGAGSGSQTIDFAHSSSTWLIHALSIADAGGGTDVNMTGQSATLSQGTSIPAVSIGL